MRVAVYNENCVRAGHIAADNAEIEAYIDAHGDVCGDWTVYEAEDESALHLVAMRLMKTAMHDARGQYQRKVARYLRQYAQSVAPHHLSIEEHWDPSGVITANSDPAEEFKRWQDHAETSLDWFGDEFTEMDFHTHIDELQEAAEWEASRSDA